MKKFLMSCLVAFALAVFLPGFLTRTEAAETPQAGIVRTASTRLNVRSGPSTQNAVLTGLEKGSYVTLISKSGNWWKVEFGAGRYGYCSADYIEPIQSYTETVCADGSRLNIRSGPSTGYSILSQYADGSTALVLSSSGGWAKVLFAGVRIGYVSEAYLGSSSVYTAVSLSVPRYAQNDARWASVRLGSSGQTIGQIGCTTCSMAMVETAVRGYTVTPSAMASELSYSSSGTLYWPSVYTAYFGNDYLEVIYRELKAGRPVMIGGFTPSGSQHWVVVTGFTGGSLTADHFQIKDPGTFARSTLSSFQSKYSVFYKIMLRA